MHGFYARGGPIPEEILLKLSLNESRFGTSQECLEITNPATRILLTWISFILHENVYATRVVTLSMSKNKAPVGLNSPTLHLLLLLYFSFVIISENFVIHQDNICLADHLIFSFTVVLNNSIFACTVRQNKKSPLIRS